MLRPALLASALIASLFACGSEPQSATVSEPGPAADVDKTPAQVEEDVAAADTATLEQTLADYKAAIAAKKDEIKALEDDLEGQLEKTLGDIEAFAAGDTTKGQEMVDDAASLEARVEALQADLEGLRDNMKIYKDELAKR